MFLRVTADRCAIVPVEDARHLDFDLYSLLFDETPAFEQTCLLGQFGGDDLPRTSVQMRGRSTNVPVDSSVHRCFRFRRWLLSLVTLNLPFAFLFGQACDVLVRRLPERRQRSESDSPLSC